MNETYSLLRSKTFWSIVFMFVFNGFTAISTSVSPTVAIIVNALLTAVAAQFHLSTAQKIGATN